MNVGAFPTVKVGIKYRTYDARFMSDAKARRKVMLVASMLLVACAIFSTPLFIWDGTTTDASSASAGTTGKVVVIVPETDESTSVEDAVIDYAKIQAEKKDMESNGTKVFVVGQPGSPDDKKTGIVDEMKDMIGNGVPPRGDDRGHGPDKNLGGCDKGPKGDDGREPPAPVEHAKKYKPEPKVISSSDITAEPDREFIQNVIDYIDGLEDPELAHVADELRIVLSWMSLWDFNESLSAVISQSTEKRDSDADPDDTDNLSFEPLEADEDDEPAPEFDIPDPSPVETASADEAVQFYYMGVTTSGLSFLI